MQYKQNLHTHTSFCDGKDTPEEMIKKAIELGFNSIGFSGHAPMYYSEKYNFNNTDQYVQEIYRLKNAYKGIIDIYCGLEYDIYCGLDTSKFEYLIGSVHYLKKDEKFIPFDRSAQFVQDVIDQNFGGDGLKFARTYYEQVIKLPEYGKFDIGYIQQDFSVDQTSRITKMMTDRQRLSSNDEAALDSLITSLIKENAKAEDSDSFDDILNAIKNKKQGN
jgi:histidinol-phosphatase (PHP family)